MSVNNKNDVFHDLRERAKSIRNIYLKKRSGSNVAVVEVYIPNLISFSAGATSKGGRKSPIPDIPIPKSQGGQFEPTVDSYSQRLMDSDSEYKVLDEIAKNLDQYSNTLLEGKLYLYSELKPCESCQGIISQFKARFPKIQCEIDYDIDWP